MSRTKLSRRPKNSALLDTPQKAHPLLNYPLFVSEVLADPPEGQAGDANRDGQYDPHKDEFIELYNAGPIPISLAGWRLGDAGSLRRLLPLSTQCHHRTRLVRRPLRRWPTRRGLPYPSIPTTEKLVAMA